MIVYKATNTINNKIYIGVTTRKLEERISQHVSQAKSDKKYKFQNALNKYGINNFKFEVIDKAKDHDELFALEKKYIKDFNSFKNGYNSTLGGEGTIYPPPKLKYIGELGNAMDFISENRENIIKLLYYRSEEKEIFYKYKKILHENKFDKIKRIEVYKNRKIEETALKNKYKDVLDWREKESDKFRDFNCFFNKTRSKKELDKYIIKEYDY